MTRDVRRGEIRATKDDDPNFPHGGFVARVLRYGLPVDDYNTTWARGVANEGLRTHMPVLAFGHQWTEPIGRARRWWEEDDGLYMEFSFDDPEDVPRARQARSQVRSGTLTDVSIGFLRQKDEKNEDGSINITQATVDEVSLVLRGAVSGAKVLAVRSAAVAIDTAVELARRVKAGEITNDEAKAALDLLAVEDETEEEPPEGEPPPPEETEPDPAIAEAESAADAALALLDRSRPR